MAPGVSTFFDTNVLVYMFDNADPARQQRAIKRFEQALHEGGIVLSTQVLHEFFNITTRKLKPGLSKQEAAQAVRQLCAFEVLGSNAASVQAALDLMLEHQLNWWDALILEAALRAGATTLLSEDGHAGQRFGQLTVENPFENRSDPP